jgi:hypothetical protein
VLGTNPKYGSARVLVGESQLSGWRRLAYEP